MNTIDLAYDVLGLEALFLVPRIFSLLSLNRYFGTLIPCLKEMVSERIINGQQWLIKTEQRLPQISFACPHP